MSESERAVTSEVHEALLDQLARKDERICMLEVMLEEAQKRAIPQGNPVLESPGAETAGPLRAERPPIKLPTLTGPCVDAIAEVVFTKAAPDARQITGQNVSDTVDEDYEPTARLDKNQLHREHRALSTGRRRILWQGGMTLWAFGLVALVVGTWWTSHQYPRFQTATEAKRQALSDSIQALTPTPQPLVPPSRAALSPAGTTGRMIGQNSVPLQVPAVATPAFQSTHPISAGAQPPHAVQMQPERVNRAMPRFVLRNQVLPGVRSPVFTKAKTTVFSTRQRKQKPIRLVAVPSHISPHFDSPSWTSSGSKQGGRKPSASELDSREGIPQERAPTDTNISDNPPSAKSERSTERASDATIHVDRAIKTLDKMQQLFDAMDQRKKSRSSSASK